MIARVKIFPRGTILGEYLPPIDVTKYLSGNGAISDIVNSVDSSDYSVGTYTFASVKTKFFDPDGLFSSSGYPTIFPNGRDVSKVEILVEEGGVESLVFMGIVNDPATREDVLNEITTFTITSPDSILSRRNIVAGSITSGVTFKRALEIILDTRPINQIMNVNPENFELDYDGIIENGQGLEGLTLKEALDQILLAANAVLVVDREGTLSVRVRTNESTLVRRFYGPYDRLGRVPRVMGVAGLNNGFHRLINTVVLNGTEYTDQAYIDEFGAFKKAIELKFITSAEQKSLVANNLIDRFRYPKREFSITVPILSAVDLDLISLISVDYQKRVLRPRAGGGRYGASVYGGALYNGEKGAFNSDQNFAYIVYGVKHRMTNFTTELKIREFGKSANDVTIYERPSQYGLGRYGEAQYSEGVPEYADQTGSFNQGRYGSSRYGG